MTQPLPGSAVHRKRASERGGGGVQSDGDATVAGHERPEPRTGVRTGRCGAGPRIK